MKSTCKLMVKSFSLKVRPHSFVTLRYSFPFFEWAGRKANGRDTHVTNTGLLPSARRLAHFNVLPLRQLTSSVDERLVYSLQLFCFSLDAVFFRLLASKLQRSIIRKYSTLSRINASTAVEAYIFTVDRRAKKAFLFL